MGQLLMAKCEKCNYSQIFKVGGGLNDSLYQNFKNEFSDTQINRITQLISTSIGQISINRELRQCNDCKTLFIMPVALISYFNGKVVRVEGVCNNCGSKNVEKSSNDTPCPQCGAKLKIKNLGLWD